MRPSARTFVASLFLAASFLGCSAKSSGSGGTATFVGITASKKAVVANGTNSVVLTVTDTSGGPVTVTTSLGQFSGGGASTTVSGATGQVTLITCACAGTATVTASHGAASAQTSITFGALATVCSADCAADAGCPALACVPAGGGTGTCSGTTPSTCVGAAACTPVAEVCNDNNVDNDCDGLADCKDPDCANQQCQAGSPTFLCVAAGPAGTCTDTTSGFAVEVTPARTRLPANGAATTEVAVKVTSGGQPASGMDVSISTNLGTLGTPPVTGKTGADGIARFTFTASAAPGVATLTASLTGAPTVVGTATITMPALGSLEIAAPQYPVQGVRGSGFQELGFVRAIARDDAGLVYPDGLAVRFEHRRLGGSTLGAPLAADTASCVAASGCVGFDGVTDTVGQAVAWLYSGTVAGTLVTTASATVAGVTRTVTLPTVAVVGARANGANFSIVCSPRNVPALAETDCAISLVEAPFTCEALLKDRYNNLLGTQTQVVFMSEAASVGAVTSTPPYDPAAPAPDLGIATQIFNTLGSGLPFDVAPAATEPSTSHDFDGCGARTHNPRDGVVTLVAIADGEEAFFDANGNGVYDAGEPFVDQGEPFVDADDSGTWNAGEWFLDVDGSGTYTNRNGVWDAATKIWTQTVVVYTGRPATVPSGVNFLGTRWADGSVGACTATPLATNFSVFVTPTPPASRTASYTVAASDMNLNRLDAGTTYGVSVAIGTVTAQYGGLASYADDLGFFYRYWPCDQTAPTPVCASQCRSTGAALPCVMTPSISGYGCGLAAPVSITVGAPTAAETDRVDWDVATPYSVFGTAKTSLAKRILNGTSAP